MAKHLWFDPGTGNASESEHAGFWRVVCENDAVSILGESGTLIGSGQWSGSGVGSRYAVDEPITDSQWGKLEHALRRQQAGTLHEVRPVAPARTPERRSRDGVVMHSLLNLKTGALRPGSTPNSSDEVGIALDGSEVTIRDHGRGDATAEFDGKYLGRREPGATVLHGNASAWNAVEQAVRVIASGGTASVMGFIAATVQVMTGEIIERHTEPSDAAIDNPFHMRISLDGDQVTIVDHIGRATATWDGKELSARDANDSVLAGSPDGWNSVEKALVTLSQERAVAIPMPRPEPARSEPRMQEIGGPPKEAKETRSGWWALAASLVAIGGAIVAWKAKQPGDTIGLVVAIALTVIAAGVVIYTVTGATTRCPRCKAWYRRETTSVENLGSSTVTRQESKAVYDSSGKQTGTTYETVTYVRTNYRYNYRCKECSNRWSETGSSESRA